MTRGMKAAALLMAGCMTVLAPAGAAPNKGEKIQSFSAHDIRGESVDLDAILAKSPDMVILYFFTTDTGQDVAASLNAIHMLYGRDKVKIIAFGVKEDEAALKQFAEDLDVSYYVLAESQVDVEATFGDMHSLPLTFILKNDRTIVKVVRGSGETAAAILTKVAETYLQQGKTEEAVALAKQAEEKGEPAKDAKAIAGYALTAAGKLDDAAAEFGEIGLQEGLARVAYERGDYGEAIRIADEAAGKSGYADTIKAMALMHEGKLDEAGAAFEQATKLPAADWQQSEAVNGQGRLFQEKGETDAAIAQYQDAVALDPYNVVALSNEGAAYREQGELGKAKAVLEQAQAMAGDELVSVMLKQIQAEMEEANDVKRGELIRQQIQDLAARYEEMKAAGTAEPADPWTTKPLVMAFLPSQNRTAVFFERAGTDVVLKRELENAVRDTKQVRVVEREMLDKLLQELNLGSSELTSQDTQLQLGKLLSAQYLGFIDFAKAGPDTVMYLRLVDTETTEIALQLSRNLNGADGISAVAAGLAKDMTGRVMDERALQGLIADASDDDAVIINLGKDHGIAKGQKFTVLDEGEPIKAGGKIIAYRPKKVAILEVTKVEDAYAICKVVQKKINLAQDMKIKASD